jgi:hypothetical protein
MANRAGLRIGEVEVAELTWRPKRLASWRYGPRAAIGRKPHMHRLKLQSGSNIVEFAFILPLLLLVVFGIIDFGLALYDKSVITYASREGARIGSVYKPGNRQNDADIVTTVTNYCTGRLVSAVKPSPLVRVSISRDDLDANGTPSSGDRVQVTVQYDYTYFVPYKVVPWGNRLRTIGAVELMRLE